MRHLRLAIPLLAAIFMAGCEVGPSVVSLHPIYDDRTLTFDPALVGSWISEDHDSWTFTPSTDGKTYHLRITDGGSDNKTMDFDAAVAHIAGFLFLDLCSENTGETGAPAHMFFKLRVEEDKLELHGLNDKWMAETVAAEGRLPYLKSHDKVVITAPTIDLQYFLQHHATDADAFPENKGDILQLTRKRQMKNSSETHHSFMV